MDLWEDDLLDDDFSDEEEELENLPEDETLDLAEDGFADWVDASDGAPENESLEEALAEERMLELESELQIRFLIFTKILYFWKRECQKIEKNMT